VSHRPAALPQIALWFAAKRSAGDAADSQVGGRPMGILELAGVYWVVLRAVLTTELGASRLILRVDGGETAIVVEWLGVVVR